MNASFLFYTPNVQRSNACSLPEQISEHPPNLTGSKPVPSLYCTNPTRKETP
jgi:hypothetical protein